MSSTLGSSVELPITVKTIIRFLMPLLESYLSVDAVSNKALS